MIDHSLRCSWCEQVRHRQYRSQPPGPRLADGTHVRCARERTAYRAWLTSEQLPCTLETIARRWGVSRERIRQIEAAALRKLQHLLAFSDIPSLLADLDHCHDRDPMAKAHAIPR